MSIDFNQEETLPELITAEAVAAHLGWTIDAVHARLQRMGRKTAKNPTDGRKRLVRKEDYIELKKLYETYGVGTPQQLGEK